MTNRSAVEEPVLELLPSSIVPADTTSIPMLITMIGAPFRTPGGKERSLRLSLAVPDGNVGRALATLKKNGGAFFKKADVDGVRWFLPWPPAAIRVSPIPTGEEISSE